MHNRANTDYDDFMTDMLADMKKSLRIAKFAGIKDEKIIPGSGRGLWKTQEHNLTDHQSSGGAVCLGLSSPAGDLQEVRDWCRP